MTRRYPDRPRGWSLRSLVNYWRNTGGSSAALHRPRPLIPAAEAAMTNHPAEPTRKHDRLCRCLTCMTPRPAEPTTEELISEARKLKEICDEAMAGAKICDHSLIILANYGDLALNILPSLCDRLASLTTAKEAAEKQVEELRNIGFKIDEWYRVNGGPNRSVHTDVLGQHVKELHRALATTAPKEKEG